MSKCSKTIAKALGIIILLAVIAAFLLVTFVSPNRFKPLIIEQVKKTTGRDLVMDGDLSWSFFPVVGIKAGHLALNNLPQFTEKTFAEIDQAIVSVKLLPLLHGQVESNGILLKGLKLHLIKNANGQTNWQGLQASPAAVASTTETEKTETTTTSKKPMHLVVNALDISDATISWVDQQTKKTFDIKNFELHAKDINLKEAFPFSTEFKFSAKNPALDGKISLQSRITLNAAAQEYLFQSATLVIDVNHIETTIKGDIAANLANDTLRLDNFSSKTANLSLQGKMVVTQLTAAPRVIGKVDVAPFDLKAFLQSLGQKVDDLQVLNPVSGEMNFAFTAASGATADGKVSVGELQTSKLKITNIHSNVHFQNKVLQLQPLTADLYQGTLNSQIKVDLNGAIPQMAIQGKLTNVQSAPLLEKMTSNQKLKLIGAANVDWQITTAGTDANTITRNLNGAGRLSFSNGVIEGIDLGHLVESAAALANKEAPPKSEGNKTTFGNLSASITIHNGVVNNNDLLMDAPRFSTKGKGTIDLVNQKIDYFLQTEVKKISAERKDTLVNLYGLAIPIAITGSLKDPTIRLQGDMLVKMVTVKELQNVKSKFQDKIQEKLQGKLPGNAGELLNNLLGN